MTEAEHWKKIENFFIEHFQMEKNPQLESMLFIIGLQELGSGKQKFSKDDKVDLLHIAVCRLLEPFGYFKFTGYREDGWPEYEQLEEMPDLKPNEQSLLMRKAIIQYFSDEELIKE